VNPLIRYIAEPEEELPTIQESPPAAYLTVVTEGRLSHSFPLRGEVQLGREKGNAIVVADQKVSRHHASLTPIDETFIVNDQGSANGTYVNGVLIAQPTRLKNNDRLGIGDTTFLFTTSQPDPNAVDPPWSPSFPVTPSRSVSPSLAPAIVSGETSIWVLVGCLALIIIALLFLVAVLLGLFMGRTQMLGLVMVGLTQISAGF
jgi:hypothetical protein